MGGDLGRALLLAARAPGRVRARPEGHHPVRLDTPAQVLAAIADLWHYATGEWLTYRTRVATPTLPPPARQRVAAIEKASLSGACLGLERVADGRRCGSLRKLFPGLAGYLAAFAVAVGTEGIEDTLVALDRQLRNDEIARRVTFPERIERRRAELAANDCRSRVRGGRPSAAHPRGIGTGARDRSDTGLRAHRTGSARVRRQAQPTRPEELVHQAPPDTERGGRFLGCEKAAFHRLDVVPGAHFAAISDRRRSIRSGKLTRRAISSLRSWRSRATRVSSMPPVPTATAKAAR